MKKIGATVALIATLLAALLALTSCDSNDTPSGMQLVAGGDSLGYYFYAPEEWAISGDGEIKAAYVSRIDTTSISFAEVTPEAFAIPGIDKDAYFFGDYFKDSLEEFPKAPKVANPDGEEIIFGKTDYAADRAKKYTYTYEYYDSTAGKTFNLGFMQIFMKKGDSYYIFTYSASMDNKQGMDVSYYAYYLLEDEEDSMVNKVISEFKFVAKTEELPEEELRKDKDGYVLISDSALSGFSLYVPESFKKDFSSAIVSATHADGTNITMTAATGTNENVNRYMLRRLDELTDIGCDVKYEVMTDDGGNELTDGENKVIKYTSVDFGNSTVANAYEYSFTYNGESYRVYQVIILDGWALSYKGYVFTYTAKDANYDLHFAEAVTKITEKVSFK